MKIYIEITSKYAVSPVKLALIQVLSLANAEIVETIKEADIVLAEDPMVLLEALKRGKKAGQLCWDPRQSRKATSLLEDQAYAGRFEIFDQWPPLLAPIFAFLGAAEIAELQLQREQGQKETS